MLYNLTKLITLLSSYILYYKLFKTENIYLADSIINTIKNGENIFWKLSQWITSRVEFMSNIKDNYLINQLKIFYEKCPTHDFEITKQIIENYYKKNIKDVFESINEIPEASGSIGQIHKGVLKNGKEVAIKVKHPDINENIINLCWILKYIVRIRFLLKKINFDLTGIEDYLMKQTNFNYEASNLIKLKNLYKNNTYIIIPEVYDSSEDFLIMEYIDGEHVDTLINNKEEHWEVMIKFWLFVRESILIHNFFHADLHKGNWKSKDGKIVVYDLGIILDEPSYYEVNTKIWQGFECRSPKILSEVITENLINGEIDRVKFKIKLEKYLLENMDIYSIDFMGDIRNLLNYLNKKKVILNFQTLTYLLAFNLASLNFKNFNFIEDNSRTYFEQHLDRFTLMKEKCQKYLNDELYKRLEKDEENFIDINSMILKNILDKKRNF